MMRYISLNDFYKTNPGRRELFYHQASASERTQCAKAWGLLFINRRTLAGEMVKLFERRRLAI